MAISKDTARNKAKTAARDDDMDDEDIKEVEAVDDMDDDGEDEAPKKSIAKKKPATRDLDDDDDDDSSNRGGASGSGDVVDLSTADEDAKPMTEVVPRGKYLCQIVETEYKEYQTGSKGMQIIFEVIEGEFAKSKTRKRAKRFYHNLVISAKAVDLLKSGLKAIGVSSKIYNSNAFSARMLQRIADSGDLIGNEVMVSVKIRMYEGNKQNAIERLQRPKDVEETASSGSAFMDDD